MAGEQGDLNETSLAIGELRAGLKALRIDHSEKARKDEEFRKAGYRAFSTLEQMAKTQEAHGRTLEEHERQIDAQDRRHARQKGVMVALGAIGSAIMGAGGLLIQYLTAGPNGQ